MPFRVAARTLLHLGAELISSDAVAVYELIKNAFDARSRRVEIDVCVRIQYERWRPLADRVRVRVAERKKIEPAVFAAVRSEVLQAVEPDAPDVGRLRHQVSQAQTWFDLAAALDGANSITVADWGKGMSLQILRDAFLTIGTRARLAERESAAENGRPILGEKGLGRLSAMRLGQRLRVDTTQAGESNWNTLEIDWSQFSHDSDALIDQIDVEPHRGAVKEDRQRSGTVLTITALSASWSKSKLDELARREFSKLTDPFNDEARYPITLRFNGEPVPIPPFNRLLFEHAHGTVETEFRVDEQETPRLAGRIEYRGRTKTFALDGTHLASVAKAPPETLRSLGPFTLKVYWYNRQKLKAIDGIGDRRQVLQLLRQWGGGVMVYRDGFRVMPYGNPDDDWLDLDRQALASGGYKVNRAQLIGRLNISAKANRALSDQTNREGLRDCDEKQVLVHVLKHVLEVEFRGFLTAIDKEVKAREPIDLDDLDERVAEEERTVEESLKLLVRRYPAVARDHEVVDVIRDAIRGIRDLMEQVKAMAESYEAGRNELIHLAGIGLMVEVVAHELNRATAHTLAILADATQRPLPTGVAKVFDTLRAQLKTLEKRLKILDPLSTAGRQRKEVFDVVALVQDVVAAHAAQFTRHHIRCTVQVEPARKPHEFRIKAVKGMVVQVLENLLSNSVYWLKQETMLRRAFRPEITITINTDTKEIRLVDNGPGVDPARREDIFEAFYTTKPAGQGKGLGLFIAREIAKYHGATLELASTPRGTRGRLNTFVVALGGTVT